jgi:heme exporter protein C
MWWKASAVFVLLSVLSAGFLVPLHPGLVGNSPTTITTGQAFTMSLTGYNTFFTRSADSMRIWMTHPSGYALAAHQLRVLNNNDMEASFTVPTVLPEQRDAMTFHLLTDDPLHGTMTLVGAIQVQAGVVDDFLQDERLDGWRNTSVTGLHPQEGFRFVNLPINYESIRNLFFHVPMWMVMFVLLMLSVWHSVRYLGAPSAQTDARAEAYAETGLLFGGLGLLTGMLWANYTWGAPWSNDIKQLMTAVALLIYVAYFILRTSFDEPEKAARIAAVYNIFAFASLIPLIYIVPRLFSSLHPGGEGSPVFNREDLNPNMRIIFYPAIIGWTLLGLWAANLSIRLKNLETLHLNR